jgi:hypothetical protein
MSIFRYPVLIFAILTLAEASGSPGTLLPVPGDTINHSRRNALYIGYTAGFSASYTGLYHLWYKHNGLSYFRFHDDSRHWLQMDKAGHMTAAYQLGKIGINVFRWAGIGGNRAIWQGGLSGLLFLTGMEMFDGFSTDYGFSLADQAANILGASVLIGQELVWKEQRMSLKFSYSPSQYARHRPELLGKRPAETWLKDYNGQTYWLSFNAGSFLENSSLPGWLCFSFGYSAKGMTGSYINPQFNSAGIEIPGFTRYRQYLFSLDLDLTKVNRRSLLMKTLSSVFSHVKFPFSAVEYNKIEGFRFRPLYF